jgi:thiamine biosynthesis protein ThiS
MSAAVNIHLNGQPHAIPGAELADHPPTMDELVDTLGFKADRIAVELNGAIIPRTLWSATAVHDGDRLEIVHFVGGGSTAHAVAAQDLRCDIL